jgi:hypothetical protein
LSQLFYGIDVWVCLVDVSEMEYVTVQVFILFIYLVYIAFYRSIVGEPVGYRISDSYTKCGMIVSSESCFIDNENKEYKDCDINDQVIN